MDADSSPYQLAHNAYIDGQNITRDAVTSNQDKIISNIVGNRLVNYTYHAGGTSVTIGAFSFQLRNTIIEFAWHPTGYHSIIEYNNTTRVRTKIFENLTDSGGVDILGFTQFGKITSVDVYPRPATEGDLIAFLDSLGRPTIINIQNFKAGLYTPVTRDIIDFCRVAPLFAPATVYANDTTRRTNNTRNKLFRFKQRWVFNDNEKSVCSPISELSYPLNVLDDTYTSVVTNNNVINCVFHSGAKNVKKVEILMSYVDRTNNWSDFVLVESYDKAANGIGNDIDFSYSFYNDSTYAPISITESIQLYSYIPDLANAMIFPNGNVALFGGITEGYNLDLVPNVVNTVLDVAAGSGGGGQGNLSVVLTSNTNYLGFQKMIYVFSGIPAVGTSISIKVKRFSDGAEIQINGSLPYVTIAGDTSDSIISHFFTTLSQVAAIHSGSSELTLTINRTTYEDFTGTSTRSQVTIVAPSTSLLPNPIPTWLWGTKRKIAIAYFDQHGKTNGILYTGEINFQAYRDDVAGLVYIPSINTKIYHVPPIWAYSYQFLFNKDQTQYIFWASVDVNTSETDYIYFDVTNFGLNASKNPTTSTVLSYSFKEGDRIRLIKAIGTTTYFNDTFDAAVVGLVAEPKISGVTQTGKTFLKIKKTAPFSNATFTPNNHYYLLQIYRPVQQSANKANEVFFEFGQGYPILNPGTNTRIHGGQVTNQSTDYSIPAEFNFSKGDSYFRSRSVPTTDTGVTTFYVQDRNFVDFYISAVSSIDGRPNIIDVNAKRSYYSTLVRFTQAYQADTNINGFSICYPNDFDQYDLGAGDIMRFSRRAKYLRCFFKFRIGKIPLYAQIQKQSDGSRNLIVTDKLINPIDYYEGNFGMGESKESLASLNYADYFADTNKGVFCRVSEDGITPISLIYRFNSFSNDNLPVRVGNYKIYGAIEQKSNNYVAALEATDIIPAKTLVFDETSNVYESFVSYQPEMMCSIGNLLVSFKAGQLWTHDNPVYNNFYGVQYDSYITLVFSDIPSANKVFKTISETANVVWDAPSMNTNIESYAGTLQSSNLIAADFTKQEGKYNAPILRDANSLGGVNNGDEMRGSYLVVKLRAVAASSLVTLNIVSLHYIPSPVISS